MALRTRVTSLMAFTRRLESFTGTSSRSDGAGRGPSLTAGVSSPSHQAVARGANGGVYQTPAPGPRLFREPAGHLVIESPAGLLRGDAGLGRKALSQVRGPERPPGQGAHHP